MEKNLRKLLGVSGTRGELIEKIFRKLLGTWRRQEEVKNIGKEREIKE